MKNLMWTYRVVLVTAMALATCVYPIATSARAFNNTDIEKFYNLSIKERSKIITYYLEHSKEDSAMLFANMQANKYLGKNTLDQEESDACCSALNIMGQVYMRSFYNYQLAAKYLLKSKQIAQRHDLQWQYIRANDYLTTLNATRNNLENNYAYSSQLIDYFKNSFNTMSNYFSSATLTNANEVGTFNACMVNIVYLAIKYDRINEVSHEIQEYRRIKTMHTVNTSFANAFCSIAEYYPKGKFEESLKFLETSSIDLCEMNQNDSISHQQLAEIVKYYLLMKCGRVKDAEAQLLRLENENRTNNMTFELLEVLNMLQLHYEQKGNDALARKYELLYLTTKDEFMGKCMLAKVDEAVLDLRLEESNEQIRELYYKHRTQTVIMWSLAVITLLSLAILVIVVVNNKRTRKREQLLYKQSIALLDAEKPLPSPPSCARPQQDETAQNALLEKIDNVMRTSSEIFNEDFTLNRLAELVDSNRNYVSQVINDRKHCNFNVMLNEYRIKEACRRLLDNANYGSYTIEGIARSVGFKSRSYFASVFRDFTGITPSVYQKMSGTNRQSKDNSTK